MTWEIVSAYHGSPELEILLSGGWEPFAVANTNVIPLVFLRRRAGGSGDLRQLLQEGIDQAVRVHGEPRPEAGDGHDGRCLLCAWIIHAREALQP